MPARRRRAILHIGTGKTGSTSIQNMLASNRAALLGQGFAYPRSPGERTHLRLAVFAAADADAIRMTQASREAGSPDVLRRRLVAELGSELAALPSDVHTVIFSNEHLTNKVASVEDALRLKALLDAWFEEYQIVVYLRRQDEYAVSHYSTLLRAGFAMPEILPEPTRADRLDWTRVLDRWAGAFGRAALVPRLFDRTAFVAGDLLADARAAMGLGPLALPPEEAVLNPSLTPPAQEFLRRLNLAAQAGAPAAGHGASDAEAEDPDDAEAEDAEDASRDEAGHHAGKVPSLIRRLLDERFAGPGRRPSRAEAEAFVAHFAATNEQLRRRYFPDRPALFSTDFMRYPEAAEPLPTAEALLDVAIAVVNAQTAHHLGDLADLMARLGRERLAADATQEARQLFRRALSRQPAHLGALRGLLEMAEDAEVRDEVANLLRRARAIDPERRELEVLEQRLQRRGDRLREPRAAAPERPPGRVRSDEAQPAETPPRRPRLDPEEAARRQQRRAERQRRQEARVAGTSSS